MKATDRELTPALEGYLCVIAGLAGQNRVARVRDIARERGVKPGSVSPAMARLERLGLIRYRQREFIEITPKGEAVAGRAAARRGILSRFLVEVLGMEREVAGRDAAALDRALSEEAIGRLARLIDPAPPASPATKPRAARRRPVKRTALADLPAGATGTVAAIEAPPALSNRLLDLGVVPDAMVRMDRRGGSSERFSISLSGFPVALTAAEARAVIVDR